jgi:glutamyl-tRNA synthetase
LSDASLAKIVPLVHERIRRLDDFIPMTEFFLSGDLDYAQVMGDLIPKGKTAADAARALSDLADELDGVRPFDPPTLEPRVRAFADQLGWKSKELFMSIRVAVTGRTAAPPLFDTMEVVGKELTRRRLRLAAQALRALRT